ncbi:hypothetical protein I3F58_23445 [Streptomyces sp. MUM 203J]|uniref:hypothetical protein n=1 Tax=Streptomyces sp. MUM 203J TaxID=2791990 RepID=UPI001F03EF34|nr:hypothetical protein [Streptomyces sp. MUM 203J]MCH0542453.1 hypothetical protein [Streptomyces sp. MUM 203J]
MLTGGPEYVEIPITLHASTGQVIVVTGITLDVTSSEGVPKRGSIIKQDGCGGGMDKRLYEVTLPSEPTSVQPQVVGAGGNGVGFPYKVTSGDPEQLSVRLNPVERDVRFTLTVSWVSDGEISN